MHHVSNPRAANQSIAEESGRPGTCRSKVGCEAIEEPCTKRMVPFAAPEAGLFQRKSLTSPAALFLVVQCSLPFMGRNVADFVQESAGLERSGGGPRWRSTSASWTRFRSC